MYWSLARCWWLGASTSLLAACWQGGATGENGSSGTEGGATATATATATAPTDASGGPGDSGDSGDSGETGGGAALDCDGPVKVGPNALRRLTRKQYHNTVRDLLGLDPPTDGFVSDKKVGPFATNSTAPVGELEVEKYMDAAEAVAIAATADLTGRLPCDPAGQEDACADQFIAEFGRRAFRRPLLADERDTLRGLYELGATQGFAAGIGLVIQGALQSPNFLYILEYGAPDPATPGVMPLAPYELATRLSYMLWDAGPDDTLLAAADAGELETHEQIVVQAERMLLDPRFAQAVERFHVEWTGVDRLVDAGKSAELYPKWTDTLRDSMYQETVRFADRVVRLGDGKLDTLLTAAYSYPEGDELLGLYGVGPEAVGPDGKVALDPTQRAGLLTLPGVLAVYAHPDRSSPVHRGKWVRENLLCEKIPAPMGDINMTLPPPTDGLTTQEIIRQHRDRPECAGCHNLMDPLGFPLENFDAIGAWRLQENGVDIDPAGEMIGTRDIDGTFAGPVAMAQRLAGSEQVRDCVATQWFRFGLGRDRTTADMCSVREATELLEAADGDIKALLVALVTSDSFRYRTAEE